MKILLTGSKGQLGQEIMNNIPKGIELIPLSRDNLDLKNYKECREIIKKLNPDWIINSGAYTKVDDAEDNRDIALAINGLAPKAFAEELSKTGGKILQISTDYVFKGDQAFPYSVNNIRNPINQYGYTKAIGEEFIEGILGENKQGVILRTSWLIFLVS